MTKAFELRGHFKQTGQDIRLHSEGGGVSFIEFDSQGEDNWLALRKASQGKELRILAEVTNAVVVGKKEVSEE